jgi:hypothetical protein
MKNLFLFFLVLFLFLSVPKTVKALDDPPENLSHNIVCNSGYWSGQFSWKLPDYYINLKNAGDIKEVWLDWRDNNTCDNWDRNPDKSPKCFRHIPATGIDYYPVTGNEFSDDGNYSWRVNINYGDSINENWHGSEKTFTTGSNCQSGGGDGGGNIGDWFLLGAGKSIKDAFSSVGSIASLIIKFLFGIAALIAFIMLLVGSIKFIFSAGDVEAAAGAKNTITYAIIGLVLVICAFAIVRVLGIVLGYNII